MRIPLKEDHTNTGSCLLYRKKTFFHRLLLLDPTLHHFASPDHRLIVAGKYTRTVDWLVEPAQSQIAVVRWESSRSLARLSAWRVRESVRVGIPYQAHEPQ